MKQRQCETAIWLHISICAKQKLEWLILIFNVELFFHYFFRQNLDFIMLYSYIFWCRSKSRVKLTVNHASKWDSHNCSISFLKISGWKCSLHIDLDYLLISKCISFLWSNPIARLIQRMYEMISDHTIKPSFFLRCMTFVWLQMYAVWHFQQIQSWTVDYA